MRDWFRSSAAHNTLTVDGESSAVPNGPFSWKTTAQCSLQKWVSEDRFDLVSAQHDGFMRLQDPAMVKREILFLKGNYWILRDTVASSQEHRIDVRFHFDSLPGTETILNIYCFANGQPVEEEAFVSNCYGQKEAAKALRFSATLKDGAGVISFLLPQKQGTKWTVREIEAQNWRAFVVCEGKTVDFVIIPATGAWVWIRTLNGQVRETLSTRISTDDTDPEIDLSDPRLSALIKDYVRH